jgi:uncharacterized protein (TIGR03067 family)
MSKSNEKAEVSMLQGVWIPYVVSVGGETKECFYAEMLDNATLIIEGGKVSFRTDDTTIDVSEITFDASRDPKTFDGKVAEGFEAGATLNGIWKVGDDGDALALFWCGSNQERPKEFKSGPGVVLIIYRRQDTCVPADQVRQ